MTYDILYYNAETGDKEKKRVSGAHNHSEALTLASKELGVDRYRLREQVFDIRKVAKSE